MQVELPCAFPACPCLLVSVGLHLLSRCRERCCASSWLSCDCVSPHRRFSATLPVPLSFCQHITLWTACAVVLTHLLLPVVMRGGWEGGGGLVC